MLQGSYHPFGIAVRTCIIDFSRHFLLPTNPFQGRGIAVQLSYGQNGETEMTKVRLIAPRIHIAASSAAKLEKSNHDERGGDHENLEVELIRPLIISSEDLVDDRP